MAKKNKKIKLNITVTPEEREYLEVLSKRKELSISQFIGLFATTEYKKLERAKKKEMKRNGLLETNI